MTFFPPIPVWSVLFALETKAKPRVATRGIAFMVAFFVFIW